MDLTEEHLRAARVIWQFHQLGHQPIAADVIVALGTNDLRVAEFAAKLYHAGLGKMLICTGGIAHQGDLLETVWDRTEAEMFADAAVRLNVPRNRILLETRATNTSENIRFTRELITRRGDHPRNAILAVKPFMQRRAWASMAVEWPEMPATVASSAMSLEEYFTDELPPTRVIQVMMGDLQRIWVYARRGWSAPQRIPHEVMSAFLYLKEAGFTGHLLPEDA